MVERNRSLPGKAVLCLQCVSPWLVEKRLSSSLEAPGARASGLRVQWQLGRWKQEDQDLEARHWTVSKNFKEKKWRENILEFYIKH